MKILLLLTSAVVCLLASCSQDAAGVNDGLRRSSSVDFGGASIRSAVAPQKGKRAVAVDRMIYYASTAALDGPFQWQIEATGNVGEVESMQVHAVKINTKRTRRTESYPPSMLGGPIKFEPLNRKKPEKVAAVFQLPGLLQVFPKADGMVSVVALIEIKGEKSSMKDWVKFTMMPNQDKSKEFFFLPTVIEYGGNPVNVRPMVTPENIYVPEPLPDPEFALPVQ